MERELLVGRSECERWAVYDAESQPIGLSAVSVDSDVALIWVDAVCRGHSGRGCSTLRSSARWPSAASGTSSSQPR